MNQREMEGGREGGREGGKGGRGGEREGGRQEGREREGQGGGASLPCKAIARINQGRRARTFLASLDSRPKGRFLASLDSRRKSLLGPVSRAIQKKQDGGREAGGSVACQPHTVRRRENQEGDSQIPNPQP